MNRLIPVLLLSLIPGAALAQGASARLTYDAAHQGLNNGDGYKTSSNASGTLAWGESYIMMSHAAMYRGTQDPVYLEWLADHAVSVLAQQDAALGLKDYAGNSRPCWQATKYSTGNLPYCWTVHTGMLTYPMAELALLVQQSPALQSRPLGGGQTLGQVAQQVLTAVEQSVATHDFQYQSGPGTGEGYYRGDPAASAVVPTVAGKALPLNQMNALGRTLIVLWKATGKATYQQKAQALCAYLRNRMTKQGATYVWTYWGTTWSAGKGEDISHAAINADFAHLCQQHGLGFTAQDMVRLGRTLFENIHQDADSVADLVDGGGGTNQYKWAVGRWLDLAPHEARVWPVAANIYRGTTSTTSGSVLLGLANLARHAPPLRGYSFYHVDWSDLGDHRKATAYGANILLLPPAGGGAAAMRLGYRAANAASVDQWDGTAYHANQRIPVTGSTFSWVFVPYDPVIHQAYSGNKVLFQFTDSFAAGQGIEVKEVTEPVAPTILTTQAPPATVGTPYSLALQGSGDAPLLWTLTAGPIGMTVDQQSGALSWTPATGDAPAVQVGLRLTNDAGQAAQSMTIQVQAVGNTDASPDSAAAGDGPAQRDAAAVDTSADSSRADTATEGGCGCDLARHPGGPPVHGLFLLTLLLWRRRGP